MNITDEDDFLKILKSKIVKLRKITVMMSNMQMLKSTEMMMKTLTVIMNKIQILKMMISPLFHP